MNLKESISSKSKASDDGSFEATLIFSLVGLCLSLGLSLMQLSFLQPDEIALATQFLG